jgi:hypothetical protein
VVRVVGDARGEHLDDMRGALVERDERGGLALHEDGGDGAAQDLRATLRPQVVSRAL